MCFRVYEPERDRASLMRTWRECGWIENDEDEKPTDLFLDICSVMVADVNGEGECFTLTAPGTLRHLEEELHLGLVFGVTTSRVARKQGLATRLTARHIAADVAAGAHVIGLGMFEQGFYDRLGFGTGPYDRYLEFDPAKLVIPDGVRARPPRRLTVDDHEAVHANRLARRTGHGLCQFADPRITQAEMMFGKGGFGLAYFDGPGGALSHHVWCRSGGKEATGPYAVSWMSWRTREQLLELLAALRGLGDQVRLVRVREPAGLQLQDLLAEPWKSMKLSERSEWAQRQWMHAMWQMRIADLDGCLARTRLAADPVRFNLTLRDPIESLLPDDAPWRGISGDSVVTLGPESSREPGRDAALPTIEATVGAFTRLWLGVRPATGLAITDDLAGPAELLDVLDRALLMPEPQPDWDF